MERRTTLLTLPEPLPVLARLPSPRSSALSSPGPSQRIWKPPCANTRPVPTPARQTYSPTSGCLSLLWSLPLGPSGWRKHLSVLAFLSDSFHLLGEDSTPPTISSTLGLGIPNPSWPSAPASALPSFLLALKHARVNLEREQNTSFDPLSPPPGTLFLSCSPWPNL